MAASKRIMAFQIVECDNFYKLKKEAQLLYFHMLMFADNEGFVSNFEYLSKMLGIDGTAFLELARKGYVLYFPKEKVAVISHWLVHNQSKFVYTADFTFPSLADKIYVEKTAQYTLRKCDGIVNLIELRELQKKLGKRSVKETVKYLAGVDRNEISAMIRKDKKKDVDVDIDVEPEKKLKSRDGAKICCGKEVVCTSLREGRYSLVTASLRVATPEEIEKADREPSEDEYELFGPGEIKNVKLTPRQVSYLYMNIGVSKFKYYVERLSDFIIEKGADGLKNHYGLIMKWAREDGAFE